MRLRCCCLQRVELWKGLPATIIIAESLTQIMGSTAGNVYSTGTIVAVIYCSITLWILVRGGGQNFLWGWRQCWLTSSHKQQHKFTVLIDAIISLTASQTWSEKYCLTYSTAARRTVIAGMHCNAIFQIRHLKNFAITNSSVKSHTILHVKYEISHCVRYVIYTYL